MACGGNSACRAMELSPVQSLALRKLIDALKQDDAIYEACPPIVRECLCDLLLPPYTSAEAQIADLSEAFDNAIRLLEKLGKELLTQRAIAARKHPVTNETG